MRFRTKPPTSSTTGNKASEYRPDITGHQAPSGPADISKYIFNDIKLHRSMPMAMTATLKLAVFRLLSCFGERRTNSQKATSNIGRSMVNATIMLFYCPLTARLRGCGFRGPSRAACYTSLAPIIDSTYSFNENALFSLDSFEA